MNAERESKLQQLSVAIQAATAAGPALLSGDLLTSAVALFGAGAASVIQNIIDRNRKLDEMVREKMEQQEIRDRVDPETPPEQFYALLLRAKDAAAKSERDEKLQYIRNFLVNSVLIPTSRELDRERYLRIIDSMSASEIAYLISFVRSAAEKGYTTIDQLAKESKTCSLMIREYVEIVIGKPENQARQEFQVMYEEIGVVLRQLELLGLLDGVGGGGPTYMYQTTPLTSRLLRFVLDPSRDTGA